MTSALVYYKFGLAWCSTLQTKVLEYSEQLLYLNQSIEYRLAQTFDTIGKSPCEVQVAYLVHLTRRT